MFGPTKPFFTGVDAAYNAAVSVCDFGGVSNPDGIMYCKCNISCTDCPDECSNHRVDVTAPVYPTLAWV